MKSKMSGPEMDKSLYARLEKLELGIDIGDVRTASTQALLAYLTECLGYEPTTADMERLVAEAQAGEEPKK